jgi:hypothetical protein
MKAGSVVKIPGWRRRGVILQVTQADILKGIDVKTPGLYLFSGMWYGKDPNNHMSFGKIQTPFGRVIGNLRGTKALTGYRHTKFT